MQDFRNLEVWKKAHKLVLAIYQTSQSIPREEVFGITMQLRRTATGIATRIAGASGRDNPGEKASDLNKAISSANELEYTLLLAGDLSYLANDVVTRLTADAVEVRKMLFGLLRAM